jgi:phospholipid N-methyltransferase
MDNGCYPLAEWIADLSLERIGPIRRALRATVVNPLSNYLPASLLKAALRFGKSELAAANWADPGGWRSMVISYSGQCAQVADRLLVNGGAMPRALRNRKRLASRVLAKLIDACPSQEVHVLCLGAGPGQIITDALQQATRPSQATLVDLSSDAFDYGRELAAARGVAHRVRFIQGDVRDIGKMLDRPPHIVKMVGICEYLTDEQVCAIAKAVAQVMPAGSPLVFNSLSTAHGNDRFFRRVFGLHMVHRSPGQLRELLASAGFGSFAGVGEPMGVYEVIVGRRMDPSVRQ